MKMNSRGTLDRETKQKKAKKPLNKRTVTNIAARYSEIQLLRQRLSAAEAIRGSR